MKSFISLLLIGYCSFGFASGQDFTTRFEQSDGRQSATYQEAIQFYRALDRAYPTIDIQEAGPTDTRYPLHVVYYSNDGRFDVAQWKKGQKLILLINNGIHPGEPDGIDASMMLLRDAAQGKLKLPNNVVLAVIPVYNIGGALNRGSYSRANQNGPEEYGFRGNAQNLDLNRDFIKMDALETQTLVQLFHKLDPDIFIDNHVSNGADYQHAMTLLTPNAQKMGYYLGRYLKNSFEPQLYEAMERQNYPIIPYVNHWSDNPIEHGWTQFYDPPRFASGFACLFETMAFVPETHMLKPFKQRVTVTYALMHTLIDLAAANADEIKYARDMDIVRYAGEQAFTLDWKPDTSLSSRIEFRGYESGYKPSDISGKPRLYYDRSRPYALQIPFYDRFSPSVTALAPRYYVIQQGWKKVIERLRINGVALQELTKDTVMTVTVYRITDYQTSKKPYEGHYLHSAVQYAQKQEKIRFLKGDYLISTTQRSRRYLVQVLEPNALDAFFAWGFFDAILQQKEGYSDYVFEDLAARLLQADPAMKKELEEAKLKDTALSKDGGAQLDFVYHRSPYYESAHMRYPVFRID